LNRALPGSYPAFFHDEVASKSDEMRNFFFFLRHPTEPVNSELINLLKRPRLERNVGVQYKPATERYSHYMETTLPSQFDCIIHLDETSALKPLDATL
jgi:erythromycin esterase-like protein